MTQDAQTDKQHVLVPVEAWDWLMGCGNDGFEPSPEATRIGGSAIVGKYWWRGDLRRRIKALGGTDTPVSAPSSRGESFHEGLETIEAVHRAGYEHRFKVLSEAVNELYFSAYWHPDRPVDERLLWTHVRDAAAILPGTTTARLGPDRTALPSASAEPVAWVSETDLKAAKWGRCSNATLSARADTLAVVPLYRSPVAEGGKPVEDTKRLEWLFSVLNDTEIKRKVMAVSDVHALGSMHGIRMRDWRHSLDVAMEQYVEPPHSGPK